MDLTILSQLTPDRTYFEILFDYALLKSNGKNLSISEFNFIGFKLQQSSTILWSNFLSIIMMHGLVVNLKMVGSMENHIHGPIEFTRGLDRGVNCQTT